MPLNFCYVFAANVIRSCRTRNQDSVFFLTGSLFVPQLSHLGLKLDTPICIEAPVN